MDIVRVVEKLAAFRADYPAHDYGLWQSFTEDEVGGQPRVTGTTKVFDVQTGVVLAEAHGTRALRPPVPGAQGAKDTRDPDRAMTQSLGRVLGLMGYASGDSVEGDTDLPDETHPTAVRSPVRDAKAVLAGKLVPIGDLRDRLNSLNNYQQTEARKQLADAELLPLDDACPRADREKIELIVESAEAIEVTAGPIHARSGHDHRST